VLGRQGFDSAALDAKRLVGFALGLSDIELATREGEPVDDAGARRVADLLQRRLTGESVARIVGEREFYGLAFGLNGATLEPRPETELLVDLAVRSSPVGGTILDLGTGTGVIAISVLVNRPDVTAVVTDLSVETLTAAQGNATRHGVVERIGFLQGSWFEALSTGLDRFDLIVSNPPYIVSAIVDTLAREVRDFDPRLALDGGPDGLAPYRIIATEAAGYLKPGGLVIVEIGYDQGASVAALFTHAGFVDVVVHKDLAGLDRVVVAHHV
jgi:release factor glutamine methyltransferase